MIGIGNDHGGYELKMHIKKLLESKSIEVKDFGIHNTDSVDYPDIAIPVCESVVNGECECGILVCGTGIGMSIVANKVPGIRCAHCHDTFSATATRLHNDSNIIAFGERVIGKELMREIVELFLTTEFEGGRHIQRLNKIKEIEEKYSK